MNNGLYRETPPKAVMTLKGGSLRGASPRRVPLSDIYPLGNEYSFRMSDNVTQSVGVGGLINSVQASSEANASAAAWKAFDVSTDEWSADSVLVPASSWLRINFNWAVVVRGIAITAGSNAPNAPKTWTWEGSNDGSGWTVIDTQTNVANWVDTERRLYSFQNGTAYLSYRINVTNVQSAGFGTGYTLINFMQLYD